MPFHSRTDFRGFCLETLRKDGGEKVAGRENVERGGWLVQSKIPHHINSIDPAECRSRQLALKSVDLASEMNLCFTTVETWIQQDTSAVFVTLPFLL